MKNERYKRAVICEELMAITDDTKEAVILHQLIYWLPRMRDIDAYIEEVTSPDDEVPETEGWIFKSASELAEETMIGSRNTVRRRLQSLNEKGLINERKNPHSEWDNTLQYRIRPRVVEDALRAEGYTLRTVMGRDFPNLYPGTPPVQSEQRSVQSEHSTVQSERSTVQSERTIPETTTETTTENGESRSTSADTPAGEDESPKIVGDEFWIDERNELYVDEANRLLDKYRPEDAHQVVKNQWGSGKTWAWSAISKLYDEHGWRRFVLAVVITANQANSPGPSYMSSVLDGMASAETEDESDGGESSGGWDEVDSVGDTDW